MSTNVNQADAISYLRRTADAAEATTRRVRIIMWIIIAVVALAGLPLVSGFIDGYNSEKARHQAASNATRPIRP